MKRNSSSSPAAASIVRDDDSQSARSQDSLVRIITPRANVVPTYKGNEVALAAVMSCKQDEQDQILEFVTFILEALERNNSFINNYFLKQQNFKCVFMVGDGPNRFKVKDVIYPIEPDDDFALNIQLCGSDDYDKIAFAAVLNISNERISHIINFAKNHLMDNSTLSQDLVKGKSLGASFAVLKPSSEKHYRLLERISIGEMGKARVVSSRYARRMEKVKSPILRSIKRLKLI